MHPTSAETAKSRTVIAVDGRPASPAMARALAQIAENGRAAAAAKARRDADPRVIARRSALAALNTPVFSALHIFAGMADGSMQRRQIMSRLVRCRIELIEGFPTHARKLLREIAVLRRTSHAVTYADDGMVVLTTRTAEAA